MFALSSDYEPDDKSTQMFLPKLKIKFFMQ
ncbi:MAG: hypothetical protein WCS06_09720 [Dysgonamonadaceae bacterium]